MRAWSKHEDAELRSSLVAWFLFLVATVPALAAEAVDSKEGAKGYQENCASCHGSDLGGRFGPPLIGKNFHDKWIAVPSEALLDYTKSKMPPANPGGLADERP